MGIETPSLWLAQKLSVIAAMAVLISGCAESSDGQTGRQSSAEDYILILSDASPSSPALESITQAGAETSEILIERGIVFFSSADSEIVENLNGIDGVLSVFPDPGLVDIFPASDSDIESTLEPPNTNDDDELYDRQWSHAATDVSLAWSLGARGTGVRVAVIDSGVEVTHRELTDRVNRNLSASFVPGVDWDDVLDPHGTKVSSVLAAEDNGVGMIGVAPGVDLVSLQLNDNAQPSIAAFQWMLDSITYAVDSDADIVNISSTAPLPTDGGCIRGFCITAEEVARLVEAFDQVSEYAWRNDTLIFAASGNFATAVNEDDGMTFLPAEARYVLTVAATGPHGLGEDANASLDDVPDYQNLGDGFIDFAAPGGTYRGSLRESGGCLIDDEIPPVCLDNVVTALPDGNYELASGSSHATPHAAGVAALVFSVLENPSAPLVLSLLRLGADDLGPPGRDAEYGFGRVNAGRSVRYAVNLQSSD